MSYVLDLKGLPARSCEEQTLLSPGRLPVSPPGRDVISQNDLQ